MVEKETINNRSEVMERDEALKGQEKQIFDHLKSLVEKYYKTIGDESVSNDEKSSYLNQIIDVIKTLINPNSPLYNSGFFSEAEVIRIRELGLFIFGMGKGLVNEDQEKEFFENNGWATIDGVVDDDGEPPPRNPGDVPPPPPRNPGDHPPPPPPPPGDPTENEADPENPNEWVDAQRKKYKRVKTAFESTLEISGLVKKKLSAADRSKFGPLWTDASQPFLLDVNLKINEFPTEQAYADWKVEWKTIYDELIADWGLREVGGKTKEDVELLSVEELVEEALAYEIPFWEGDAYSAGENNEYKAALAERIRWGEIGWEDYDRWTGQKEGRMNDLDMRELTMRLQLFALQALQLRRKGFAEGDRSKLFESLTKIKLHREQLMLLTCHPRYGEFLTKSLKLCQELPILRPGALSPELRTAGHRPLNDRVVLRDGVQKLLHGDQYWEVTDENDPTIITSSGYNPAEQLEPGDTLLYEYDSNFTYESLGGDTGRNTYKKMITKVLETIKADPLKFGIDPSEIPDAEDEKKVKFFSEMIYYAFPFLSYALAKRKERTQTDSHNTDLEEDINWMLVFSPIGQAVHSAHRYGASKVAWLWMLVYYPELQTGHHGAGGEAEELNELRELMIMHQECFYDMSEIAGSVPFMPFGDSEFISPLDMITPSPEERVALKGKARLRDGTIVEADPSNPKYLKYSGEFDDDAKKSGTMNFDLLQVAIDGWLKFLKECLTDMSGELEQDAIVGGEGEKKGVLGKLMGDFLGRAKMFFTKKPHLEGTDFENFDHLFGVAKPILWHMVKRTFYAFKYNDAESRKSLFLEAMEAIDHNRTKGGLSGGTAKDMASWLYERMKGTEGHRYGVEKRPSWFSKALGVSENVFQGMNIDLGPVSEHDWGGRHEQVYNYLKALWEWKRGRSGLKLGDAYGDFPFKLVGEFMILGPVAWGKQRLQQSSNIKHFQAMFEGQTELELPVTRTGLKTGSSAEEKK